jgi:pyridoxine 5-phosphate synthase
MKLSVNVDHVATLRQARLGKYPSPVEAALLVEKAGAHGITVHLREDRRHIQDYDVWEIKKKIKIKLNLEMAATHEIIQFALKVKPFMCTIVPEKRQELTTEGGLDVIKNKSKLLYTIEKLHKAGILVSLFVNPEKEDIRISKEIGADFVEIHTGRYADAENKKIQDIEFNKIKYAVKFARSIGIKVNAGHGLNYSNIKRIAKIKEIEEVSIGHSIIARAVYVGIYQAVKEMLALIKSSK